LQFDAPVSNASGRKWQSIKEETMKMRLIAQPTSMVLFAVLAISSQLSAQRPRYKLIDIGTFGGPTSVYNVFTRIATNDAVVGAANTAAPDLNAPDCFDPDTCLVQHAWEWRRGVLTDLGVLTDGFSSYTNAINERGVVVGQSQRDDVDPLTGGPSLYKATVWRQGRIRSLGTFGGANSIAIAVTDQNFVMGVAENGIVDTSGFPGFDGVSQIRSFGWSGGRIFDLGTLGGTGAFANDMNNLAQIVGVSPTTFVPRADGSLPVSPFLWESGRMRNLGSLGGAFGAANAINNRGQIVGYSTLVGDLAAHAFLWEHGKMRDLGSLGGNSAGAEWLNDTGDVIGESNMGGGDDQLFHAFLWRHGTMTDLGTVGTDNASNAFGINASGQVAGQSWFWDGNNVLASHAFVYEKGGPMLDLNTLVSNKSNMNLVEANFINDRGWIVARGFLPNGDLHTAILIPEDEASEAASNTNVTSAAQAPAALQTSGALTPQMRAIVEARLARSNRLSAIQKTWHPRVMTQP
jgi:probable HAF family extracellular repeat protein